MVQAPTGILAPILPPLQTIAKLPQILMIQELTLMNAFSLHTPYQVCKGHQLPFTDGEIEALRG